MKTLWILSLLALGCSPTVVTVKPCEVPLRDNPYISLEVNPYEETLEANPYPEKPQTCEEICLSRLTSCFQECLLSGATENACLAECVNTDDCLSQC